MSKTLSSRSYLERVEQLSSDMESDDKDALITELRQQLDEVGPDEAVDRLGSPDEFVDEFRKSAGLTARPSSEKRTDGWWLATVVSALAIPFGVLVLFSFGGQVFLGPFVLAIEWLLARISPRPLRILWSMLAGLLAGEITYLALSEVSVAWLDGITGMAVSLLVAAAVTTLFVRTTRR